MKWLKQHRFVVIATIGVMVTFWLVLSSESFQECVSNKQNADAEKTFYECISHFLIAFGVLRGCTGYFIHEAGDAITALATLLIALFTWTLYRATTAQGVLTGKALELSTTATQAAIAAERARFHVIIDDHNLREVIRAADMYGNSPNMSVGGEINVTYHFKNYGKGPGLITEISHGLVISETPPDTGVYTVVRQVPKEYMVPSLGETEQQTCDAARPFDSIQTAMAVKTGRMLVWFFGRFDYIDFVTNSPQVHRFLLRYIQTEGGEWRFQTFDYKHYNQST